MSQNVRVIPKLDIKGPNLVKGIHLEGLRVLGKPEDFAKHYYENGADELIYIDVVASLYGRNSLHDIVSRTAKNTFIPLTVAGGLRTIEDIRSVLRAGADKVAINTAAINNPSLIQEASRVFGSSTITITIEAIKQNDGTYLAYTDNGREYTGVEVLGWAKRVQELGAGEILLTSIDREGTGNGYDTELTKMVSDAVSIPVIACGGAGITGHVIDAVKQGHASAVAIASMFHYNFIDTHKNLVGYQEEGNIEFLKSGSEYLKRIERADISDVKKALYQAQIPCRWRNRM